MILMCPNCQKMVTISDQQAGQTLPCPSCGQPFTAPALAASSAPSPVTGGTRASPQTRDVYGVAPPVQVPPAPPPRPPRPEPTQPAGFSRLPRAVEASAPPASLLPGYQHVRTITASPRVVPWLAPVCLALVFVVLCLPWVVLPTQTDKVQTGWQTGFGSYFHMLGTLHVLSYLLALFLAIICVAVPALDPIVPPWVAEIWPWRSAILAALLSISLLFFLLEIMNGFGLEHAEFGREYYAVHRTIWTALAWWLQVLALVGALLDFWLVMRKTKPVPRIDISW